MSLISSFKTQSGRPLRIGTGTGTKWQWLKKNRPAEESDTLSEPLVEQLLLALNNGFYHIDTAETYTTHQEVGEAIKRSGIKREDLWITDKYSPGYRQIKAPSSGPLEAIDSALKKLNTTYIDLYLLHSPFITVERAGLTLEEAWKQLEVAHEQGKVKNIGVSNHSVEHLNRIFKIAKYKPQFNQIEFHPFLQDQTDGIVEFAEKNNILIEAYGPLTPLFRIKDEEAEKAKPLLEYIGDLSKKYGKTDSQILLRYTLQKGILPITTSAKLDRIKQVLDVYEFELKESEVSKISEIGSKYKFRGFFVEDFAEFDK